MPRGTGFCIPYPLGAKLLGGLWTLPPARAFALWRLTRKRPEYKRHVALHLSDRDDLRKHLCTALFRDWRETALDRASPRTLERFVRFEGVEHLEAARAQGRGVILAASHYAASQTLKILIPRSGVELLTIGYRRGRRKRGPWRHARVFWLTDQQDDALLLRALVAARKVLRRGGAVQLPADGRVGRSEIELPFLGRLRPFASGFATLAATTDSPVIPVFAPMQADGRITVEFQPPLVRPSGLSRADTARELVRQYAAALEQKWREDSALVTPKHIEWLWRLPLVDAPAEESGLPDPFGWPSSRADTVATGAMG